MKHTLAIMLAISFTALAVFGVFAMHHDMERGHSGCLAVTAAAEPCPLGGSLAVFLFHAETFRYFSLAIATVYALITLLILLFVSYIDFGNNQRSFFQYYPSPHTRSPLSLSLRVLRWISLHENSPSFI